MQGFRTSPTHQEGYPPPREACCRYGFQVKTEWGGDAALARPSLLPSTITKTRSKLFFDLFRISPLTSPNQFIFQDKIMNKNQIEEKQCRKEHDRCIGDNACNWQHFSISAAIWFSTGLSRNTVHNLLQPVNHCDCPLEVRSRSSFLL